MQNVSLISKLNSILGAKNVLSNQRSMAPYLSGFRVGSGSALAVIKPTTLVQMWDALELLVEYDVTIIMQAANTGLTGGSTPTDSYDREVVVINTLNLDSIHILPEHSQFVAFPGATLFDLEKKLDPLGRMPHSVIGSSCIGASIVGGVCNSSGGALVERGPAYTELALFAQIDQDGNLQLVNNLDINLGTTPREILSRLETHQYKSSDVKTTNKKASDSEYKDWVRDISSEKPARYNADKRRLYQASGSGGKLAVFAVRVDSFIKPTQKQTYYIGTKDKNELQRLRVAILKQMDQLPISAEYLHSDIFNITREYGKDVMLLLRFFGTKMMPNFFRVKKKLENLMGNTVDYLSNIAAKLFPNQIPERLLGFNARFEHQLIITVDSTYESQLLTILDGMYSSECFEFFKCSPFEANQAYLLRFAAAGAAIQYSKIKQKNISGLIALDIALPKNCYDWFGSLPTALQNKLDLKLYYGHFLCHVFHQDYIVKSGFDTDEVKNELLAQLDNRGAEYPAEHNVGHVYQAKHDLSHHYQTLDPTNTFNPGVGQMSKNKFYE